MIINTEYYDSLLKLGKREEALEKSIGDFVATLFYNVFKEMYESIPRSGLIPETSAQRWFNEMLLYEYSKKMARRDLKPLVDMIKRHLVKKVYKDAESSRHSKEVERKSMRSDRRSQGDEHDNDAPVKGSDIGKTGEDFERSSDFEEERVHDSGRAWRVETEGVRFRQLTGSVFRYGF